MRYHNGESLKFYHTNVDSHRAFKMVIFCCKRSWENDSTSSVSGLSSPVIR